jgi:hypothetical protein
VTLDGQRMIELRGAAGSQTPAGLNDFHISYELNASVCDVQCYRQTLSALLEAIQNPFAAAGMEILSPSYHAIRNGNRSTLPERQT